MLKLKNITLLGVDCIDLVRLKVARDICVKKIEFGAVKLLTSIESDEKDVIKIGKIGSLEAYSEFMIKKLYDYVDTEFVLIFQHDGFILSADNWRVEFLNYDYIGAPWIGYYKENPQYNVGNGGFSLRSKRLLNILANDENIKLGQPEDAIISRQFRKYLESKGIKYAPEEIASKFAIPDIMNGDLPWTDQFGFHYLTKGHLLKWLIQNPEYKNIVKIED